MALISANLLYRLKADTGVTASGGRISAVTPHSGSVTADAVQATSGSRPYAGTDNRGRPVFLHRYNTNCWLDLPASLSVDARNVTVYCVKRDWRGGATYLDSAAYSGEILGTRNISNTTGGYLETSIRSNPAVRTYLNMDVAVTSNSASAANLWNSLVTGSVAAPAAGTLTDCRMGEFSQTEIYDLLIYNATHTALEVAQNIAALGDLYPDIRLVPWTRQIITTGDSITHGSAPGGNDAAWPSRMIWDFMPNWRCSNQGSSGSTCAGEATKKPVMDWYVDTSMSPDVIAIQIGRNDMAATGGFQLPSTVYANLVSLVQSYISTAPTRHVWVGTLLSQNGGNANDDDYNARIRGTLGYTGIIADAGAKGLLDFAADPIFATYNASYMYDSIHPNAAGAYEMARIASQALNRYYGGTGNGAGFFM